MNPDERTMATSSDEDDTEETPPSPSGVNSAKNGEANLGLLVKVFPHLDKQILTMILKACNNDLIQTIETLIHENPSKPVTPIPPLPHTSLGQRISLIPPHMPFNPTMPRPAVLQPGGLPFAAAVYPGYVHGFGPHGANSPGIHQWKQTRESAYRLHGGKTPWCITLPSQPFCKKAVYSRALVSPNLLNKTMEEKCENCSKLLSASDKFCSQCGNMTSTKDKR